MAKVHARLSFRLLVLPFLAVPSFFGIGCASTERQLKLQEIEFLESKTRVLQEVRDDLQANPNPEEKSDLSIFVSAASLNRVLALADETLLPIEQIDGAFLVIGSVRTAFDYGSSDLTFGAAARRRDLEVSLRVTAELVPEVVGDELILRIHAKEVVPVARWSFLQIRLRRFVEALLRVEANEYLKGLPDLRLPLDQATNIHLAGREQQVELPTDHGKIFATYTLPEIRSNVAYRVNRVLLLPDGIHVFFSFA